MGIALSPGDGQDASTLIKNADTAMYHAKEWGHNAWRCYAPEMSAEMADRFELETALRVALERDEFVLYYQPQVDTRSGDVVGVEALLRWRHPTQGVLAPHVFLPLAEQSGLIGPIGRWVLKTACAQMQHWVVSGFDVGKVAINLTAREFTQEDVVSHVRSALSTTGLNPARLELEITESTAMHNTQRVLFNLMELREMGVRIAIDDFGTGYSAMSYLRRFPIHTLKIAQTFMRDAHVDPQSAAIATMIIELARELRLEVVAEGVEHPRQLEFLTGLGCHVVQGFLFSEPKPPADLKALIEARFRTEEADRKTRALA
jgi:EAL domain-containing protein (putative c-di-GMP-specific phosphodiesterase class I)